jgi:spermidine/putrescine ABC transporter ATP-binding subunit
VSPPDSPDPQPVVELVGVSKSFGETKAVDRVSFEIRPGEFFSLLGPSGCGKTTTLRLLAGFEEPDQDGGEVRILGQPMNNRRPYERNVSMVFQNYALFPHLNVEKNVGFGLEQRKVAKPEISRRVRESLQMVRLDPDVFARRLPAQLSGGQRQRVALARALILEAPILLLDEPLGAIDLKLRKEMQIELRALNKELGITFVYVTHDQEEALTMSDRIAVMDHARIAQIGTPAEIYENPRTSFVARFIGESNFFEGKVAAKSGSLWEVVDSDGGRFRVPDQRGLEVGANVRVAVRPEWMELSRADQPPADRNTVAGSVREIFYLGETMHVVVTLAKGTDVIVALRNEGQLIKPLEWKSGDSVLVRWRPEDCQVLEDA